MNALGEFRIKTAFLVICACLLSVACVSAQDKVQLESDSVERDYSDELPRIPATTPEDSLSKFQIADGFRIELAAYEPLVTDPIAMSFDEFGRLYVVCMRGYS
ncbi:MAG: hypothetical protein KDB27_12990 [Planctomycetales bacterium]|nr:hypothetical protein [Planctomycetales bacterium]